MTRRGAGAVAALAVASAVLFNLPAQAENEACGPLQGSYIANPTARPQLLAALRSLGCSVPGSGTSTSTTSPNPTSSSSSTSSTTSSSTTTTVFNPNSVTCTALVAAYTLNPASQATLLAQLQAAGCTVPTPATTTTQPTTTTSSSSSTTSSSTTSTTPASTTTTVAPSASCAGLIAAYLAAPAETQPSLLPVLRSQGCTVPVVTAGE